MGPPCRMQFCQRSRDRFAASHAHSAHTELGMICMREATRLLETGWGGPHVGPADAEAIVTYRTSAVMGTNVTAATYPHSVQIL